MAKQRLEWFVVISCMLLVSISSWAWLVHTTYTNFSRRLFTRQMLSLAVAGFIMSVAMWPVVFLHFWHLPIPGTEPLVCEGVLEFFVVVRLVCILQETHISLTFLAQSARWTTALPCLNRAIPAVWAFGLLLGLWDVVSCPRRWQEGACRNTCPDTITSGVLLLCWVVSVLSYLELLRSTWRTASGSVLRRSIRRAVMYPVIAVASYSAISAVLLHRQLFHQPSWFLPLALTMEASNGWMNTLAYTLQTRPDARSGVPAQNSRDGASFHVMFRVDESIFDILEASAMSSERGDADDRSASMASAASVEFAKSVRGLGLRTGPSNVEAPAEVGSRSGSVNSTSRKASENSTAHSATTCSDFTLPLSRRHDFDVSISADDDMRNWASSPPRQGF